MARRIEHLALTYTWMSAGDGQINVDYMPMSGPSRVTQLQGSFPIGSGMDGAAKSQLDRAAKFARVFAAVFQRLEELEIRGKVVQIPTTVTQFTVNVLGQRADVRVGLPGVNTQRELTFDMLPPGGRRLLDSLTSSLDARAWLDFQARLEIGTEAGPRVFISYRSTHQWFAEAFAERLAAEGLIPWFDKWEILAGDSIPGKIEEGLHASVAFMPILTSDYPKGPWATEELQSAIAKRVEGSFKIIPVLLEPCDIPELIRHLRYVDFSARDTETFESKIGEAIDAIYGLAVNPLRR